MVLDRKKQQLKLQHFHKIAKFCKFRFKNYQNISLTFCVRRSRIFQSVKNQTKNISFLYVEYVCCCCVQNILWFANTHRNTQRQMCSSQKKVWEFQMTHVFSARQQHPRLSAIHVRIAILYNFSSSSPFAPCLLPWLFKPKRVGRPNGTFPPFGRKWNRQRSTALAQSNGEN